MKNKLFTAFIAVLGGLTLSISDSYAQNTGEIQGIDDQRTVNPDQNSDWKSGENPYPARPRDMWELGVDLGHSMVSGDIEPIIPSGFSAGLHLRRALNYNFSLRLSGNYYSARGVDARAMSLSTIAAEKTFKQNDLSGRFGDVRAVHRNYKTSVWTGGLELVFNFGNLLFHQANPKWNFNLAGGLGFEIPKTHINFFDGNGNYNWASASQGLDVDKKSDRKKIRKNVKDMLDNSWETKGGVDKGVYALGDDKTLYPMLTGAIEVVRKLSDRVNIGLKHQIILADNDLLDGFEYRYAADLSNSNDILHYTGISLNFNLGSFSKRAEPLYWVNPMGPVLTDLAEVKARPYLDLTDSDGDGVIDLLDQEPDTPEGAPVDVRGVALDSDGDGIPDYRDKEPFSPPGYDVDEDGVAIIPDAGYLSEREINELVNNKLSNMRMDWWLPMVNFDLDKYYVRPEYYGQLKQVATVMMAHPDQQMVVRGYADNRGDEVHNRILSYNRAKAVVDHLVERYDLPRERFLIQYRGEAEELIPDLEATHGLDKQQEMQQFLNRRVEFYVARPGDEAMEKPDGPEAGEDTPGSSRPGPKYSGNKNSGY